MHLTKLEENYWTKKGRFKLLKGSEKLTANEKQQLDEMLEEHSE